MRGGLPLLDAMAVRHSTREYSGEAISEELLSGLLWAACGVNRVETGGRTAPYWRHVMVMDVYVAMADGVWLYAPEPHALLPCLPDDLRAQTGLQGFAGEAPVDLVYVAHGERMHDLPPAARHLYAAVDAAFIGENVYLFCASEGLGTVFHGALDHAALEQLLGLEGGQFVTFAQTVGYSISGTMP